MALDLNLESGEVRGELRQVLLKAFGAYDSLEMLLSDHLQDFTGASLPELASDTRPMPVVVNAVLQSASEVGYGLELLLAALVERRGNPGLLRFAADAVVQGRLQENGLSTDTRRAKLRTKLAAKILKQTDSREVKDLLRLLSLLAGEELAPDRDLERRFLPVDFQNPADWRARMAEIERRVCRVETPGQVPPEIGSGFLVGPDLVLTNFHVLFHPQTGKRYPGVPDDLGFRFDCVSAPDGEAAGTTIRPIDDPDAWCVDSSPVGELDFALVRVQGRPGDGRGFEDVRHFATPGKDETVFILQHPEGDTLKLAAGAVLGVQGTPARLLYRANTEPGSSGSPCYNLAWQIAALHHRGSDDANHGVPFRDLAPRLVPHL